ncbi:MAG: GNAT family N-acetyltransferase [Clostridiales bacterium]|nr:GNAT family N-acetyltransferase [Clostridiales bacterium]
MKVRDLTPEDKGLYCVCLEEWSDEMVEAGDHKSKWYDQMKDKGLRVKLVEDDNGVVSGMIQYLPISYAFVQGQDLYVILCIWVHGHKQGRGDCRKQGMGKALLKAAEEDVRALGAKGLVAWGLVIPVFIRAAWYKKQGYQMIDKNGVQALLWKPFTDDAQKPTLIRPIKKPEKIIGQVTVTSFINGWCPATNIGYERAKRACANFGDQVVFRKYDTSDREVYMQWGIMDALFVDDKEINLGPPPSYEKIFKAIKKKAKKIK